MSISEHIAPPLEQEGRHQAELTARQRRQARRESVTVSVAMLVVVSAAILGLWVTSRNSIYENFRHYLISLAEAAVTQVDPALQAQIRRPEQQSGPDYLRAVEPLRRLRDAVPDIHYIYTLVLEDDTIHFVLDAAEPAKKTSSGGSDQSVVWEVYHPHQSAILAALGHRGKRGLPDATTHPVSDKWGTFMTGFAPILDSSGHQIGAVGVDVDASVYLALRKQATDRALLGLIPAISLIVILGYLFYRVRMHGLMDLSARKAMESAMIEAAQRDRLTGLPNRTVFMEHLERTLARVRAGSQSRFAVLFLDFDRFKLINDTLGHQAGDQLLRQIGQRLQSALGFDSTRCARSEDDLISRFGGDEFLMLVNDEQSARDAKGLAERLLTSLAQAYNLCGSEVHSMASVGIVTSEQCAGNAEEVVRNADLAMYEAKRSGRGCSVVFDEAMHARLRRRVAIENGLRRAVGNSELYLEFQPIVDLNSGRRPYVEALVRWNHPTLGLVEPEEFIPIAEESGVMIAVGQWVLENACRAMLQWRSEDPQHAPEQISVNLSRAELNQGALFLEQLRTALAAADLPPQFVQLEITQRDVMRDPETARDLLVKLGSFGVKLAMDDFGTGTASLSHLRGYPFDVVKIDRTFLKDLHSSHEVLAVIHATIGLIANFGMASLAEGVEDAEQVAILQSLGCSFAQGFYFSRPVPAHEVFAALANTSGTTPTMITRATAL